MLNYVFRVRDVLGYQRSFAAAHSPQPITVDVGTRASALGTINILGWNLLGRDAHWGVLLAVLASRCSGSCFTGRRSASKSVRPEPTRMRPGTRA